MDRPGDGDRLLLAAALVVALLATFLGQHDRQLWAPDEAREAGITAAMARSGDWVVPRLNGRPFLEKPPLFHAAGAAVLHATGSTSPFAIRLPAALFAMATLAATFVLGRRIGGTRLGALAAMVLATTSGFYSASHRAVTDNAIPPFVTLAFVGLASLLGGGAPGPAFALSGAACGVAFLAKGAIGPALIAAGWVAALLLSRQHRRLLDPMAIPGLLLAVLPATAWLLALHGEEGAGAVRTVLVDNNWGRAAAGDADHARGPLYYLAAAPVFLLPWIPLVLLGAARAWREGGLRRIPLAWLGAGLLLLTAASAKRHVYLLPLAPAAALLAALEIEALFFTVPAPRFARTLRAGVAVMATGGLAAAASMDWFLRGEDLLTSVAGVLLAVAGTVVFLGGPVRVLAFSFVMVAAAYAFGFRALGPAADEEQGLDRLAAEVVTRSPGRDLVLFRPSEAVEGILTLRCGGTIPTARTPEDLREAVRLADREVLVVGRAEDGRFRPAVESARATWRVGAWKGEMLLALLTPPEVPGRHRPAR